jgi:hypothetical protein
MPVLKITSEVEISDAEQALLCEVLRCAPDQLERQVGRYSVAAIREYLDMFTGAASITTASDLRERRLVGLMTTAFADGPPDADQISRLFNVTPTAARSLLRSVAAKYRLRLKSQMEKALAKVLADCRPDAPNGAYSVVVINPILVELLNARLATSPQPKTPIRRSGDSLTRYTVDRGSYEFLTGQS